MKEISILGRTIELMPRDKSSLRGVTLGDWLSFGFYDGEFQRTALLFAEPKGSAPSPHACRLACQRMEAVAGKPVVLVLAQCPTYERQRLLDHGVYFVVGSKFAHLPMLVANERMRQSAPAQRLTPVAQYLLLHHLQMSSLEGLAARDIIRVPYSYASVTLGLTCLADVGLCQKVSDGAKRKTVHFAARGMDLWQRAQPFVIDPVEKRLFCNRLLTDMHLPQSGIPALSRYSRLSDSHERVLAVTQPQLKQLQGERLLQNPNPCDGDTALEVWKYPPLSIAPSVVDPLSLVLALRGERDPRVESETEYMLNHILWKD